jgi:hypothetical protein
MSTKQSLNFCLKKNQLQKLGIFTDKNTELPVTKDAFDCLILQPKDLLHTTLESCTQLALQLVLKKLGKQHLKQSRSIWFTL